MKDLCLTCGKETPYTVDTHIDLRLGYIEGAGQHCFQPKYCEEESTSTMQTVLNKLTHFVESTPDNQELGEAIRNMYYELKNK
jgi:hypothetical protein